MSFSSLLQRLSLLALLSPTTLALPSISSLELSRRDNQYHLTCGNAPSIIAGDLCPQSAVTSPPPDPFPFSGSNEPWMAYLWCTPGTNTYTFFNIGEMTQPPLTGTGNLTQALVTSIGQIETWLASNPDGPVYQPGQEQTHYWYTDENDGSDYVVFAEGRKTGTLTFGILHSALTGLLQFMQAGQIAASGYDKGSSPIVFQINDGQWGEVGIGYVGYTNWPGQGCVYQVVNDKPSDCVDVPKGNVIQ